MVILESMEMSKLIAYVWPGSPSGVYVLQTKKYLGSL